MKTLFIIKFIYNLAIPHIMKPSISQSYGVSWHAFWPAFAILLNCCHFHNLVVAVGFRNEIIAILDKAVVDATSIAKCPRAVGIKNILFRGRFSNCKHFKIQ